MNKLASSAEVNTDNNNGFQYESETHFWHLKNKKLSHTSVEKLYLIRIPMFQFITVK